MNVCMSNKKMLEHYGVKISNHPDLQIYILAESDIDPITVTEAHILHATNDAIEAYCAVAFLYSLNHDRYQDLLD